MAADESPPKDEAKIEGESLKEKLRREILRELNLDVPEHLTSDEELMRALEDALTMIGELADEKEKLTGEIALAKEQIVSNLRDYETTTRNRNRILRERFQR